MLETNKPQLEDLPEGELLPAEGEKPHIPVAGIIIISSIVLLVIACIIVILAVNGGKVPPVNSSNIN